MNWIHRVWTFFTRFTDNVETAVWCAHEPIYSSRRKLQTSMNILLFRFYNLYICHTQASPWKGQNKQTNKQKTLLQPYHRKNRRVCACLCEWHCAHADLYSKRALIASNLRQGHLAKFDKKCRFFQCINVLTGMLQISRRFKKDKSCKFTFFILFYHIPLICHFFLGATVCTPVAAVAAAAAAVVVVVVVVVVVAAAAVVVVVVVVAAAVVVFVVGKP